MQKKPRGYFIDKFYDCVESFCGGKGQADGLLFFFLSILGGESKFKRRDPKPDERLGEYIKTINPYGNLRKHLKDLVDVVGISENFLVYSLVKWHESFLERLAQGYEQAVEKNQELRSTLEEQGRYDVAQIIPSCLLEYYETEHVDRYEELHKWKNATAELLRECSW